MGKLIETFWTCPYCGTKDIRGRYRECPSCGRPRGEIHFDVNYSATSNRASCFTHHSISYKRNFVRNVLHSVHRRIGSGSPCPTVS